MNNINKEINVAIQRVVILYIFIVGIILSSAYLAHTYHQRTLANSIADSARNNLVIKDLREAINILSSSLRGNFNSISFYDSSGKRIFNLTSQHSDEDSSIWSQNYDRNIFSDEANKKGYLGKIHFTYTWTNTLLIPFLTSILCFFIGIPFLRKIRNNILEKYNSKIRIQEAEAVSNLAKQVAHDIRSPLTALNMVIQTTNNIPENDRVIIRSASQRINDIANNLLLPHRATQNSDLHSHLISALTEDILTEKRMQYRGRLGIYIKSIYEEGSYGIFGNIVAGDFKRVISNLINNSVESFVENQGEIAARISKEKNLIKITIQDNGQGIPPEQLIKIGKRGETYNKKEGSGLGLSHAKAVLDSWGGTLIIESQVGSGTKVVLSIPMVAPPKWFKEKISIKPHSTIAIIDDDISIHQTWKERLNSLNVGNYGIKIYNFLGGDEFLLWKNGQGQSPLGTNCICLVDYELLGQTKNGLDIIEESGIQDQSILVTSHYEDEIVLTRCQTLNLAIIPKALAIHVPIIFETSATETIQALDAVLIDDDVLISMLWEITARNANKKIKTYSNIQSFLTDQPSFDRNTPLYIDSQLKDGTKGEVFAKKLYEEFSFQNIYLATAFDKSHFESMPWIKEIRGKTPPF